MVILLSKAIFSDRVSNSSKLRNRTPGCFDAYFYMCSRERKKLFLDFGREADVLNCFYTGFVHVNTFHIVHHALNQFWIASQQLLVPPFMKLIRYKYLLFIRFFWYSNVILWRSFNYIFYHFSIAIRSQIIRRYIFTWYMYKTKGSITYRNN